MKYTIPSDTVLFQAGGVWMLTRPWRKFGVVPSPLILNRTAAVYWRRLEEGNDTCDILENLSVSSSVPMDLLKEDFQRMLENLVARGFIEVSSGAERQD